MKNIRKVIAIVAVLAVAISVIGVFALDYAVPEFASRTTQRFFVMEDFELQGAEGEWVSMIGENGDLIIHIGPETIIYFEDFVPLSDDYDGLTRDVREVLFGRTLAEVLDGRNMVVTYGIVAMSYPAQTTPISIQVLFETAVALPWIEIETGEGYENIVTLPEYIGDLDWDDVWIPELNGEFVINNEIMEGFPAPFWTFLEDDGMVAMVPLRAIAEALGYDVGWSEETQSVMLGVGIHLFIGRTEVYVGRMAPIELSTAPIIVDNSTFVPLDFVRNVLGQNVWVFEGQVVVDSEYEMM